MIFSEEDIECETRTDFELSHLFVDVTFGEVLDISELQVHLSEPYQHSIPRSLKLLPLRCKVLQNRDLSET